MTYCKFYKYEKSDWKFLSNHTSRLPTPVTAFIDALPTIKGSTGIFKANYLAND